MIKIKIIIIIIMFLVCVQIARLERTGTYVPRTAAPTAGTTAAIT